MAAAGTVLLDRRARHRAEGAKHTAIACFRMQERVAGGALIEELARRGGHGFGCLVPACRARKRTLQLRLSHRSRSPWPESRRW